MTDLETPRTDTPGTQAVIDAFGTTPKDLFQHHAHLTGATAQLVYLVCDAARAADRTAHGLVHALGAHADVLRNSITDISTGRSKSPRPYRGAGLTLDEATHAHAHALAELDRAVTALGAAFRDEGVQFPKTTLGTHLTAIGAVFRPGVTFRAGPIHLPTGTITLPDILTADLDGGITLQRRGVTILTADTHDDLASAHVLYAALRTYSTFTTDATPQAIAAEALPLAATLLRERPQGSYRLEPKPGDGYPRMADEDGECLAAMRGEFVVYRVLYEVDDEEETDEDTTVCVPDGAPQHWDAERWASLMAEVFTATFD
ncbi:hypothetical protein ACFZBU_42275 [Embleya sp. NPDC008237]|uniref:hypothetical protein n=1 Tax=Embleya sp. NPDC008237 TaxID=3363978 RepID=UPI0036E71A98